ncbi:MAG: zinc-ribbon domain-containing protein, partial [Thermoanaerobaculia bacterium]|nr:zinc-ribbon domain-containing protein [Thermoanaerobaculia bacterium]
MTEVRRGVECPNCGTRLRLNTAGVTSDRIKVRCSSCRQAFAVRLRSTDSSVSRPPVATSASGLLGDTVAAGPLGSSSSRATGDETMPDLRTFKVNEEVAGRYR